MSLAGVLLGMLVTGMTFSAIMTGLGIVALAGIVVKNGIVLTDTYNHYTRDDGVEPIKAMLITVSQRVRPVLLTATVTSLGVIPMALNIEFDFIRREMVVGGIAGSWFTHLSAALVSGLFVSTALTLVMVPVMIVAPQVAGHQIASSASSLGSGTSPAVSSAWPSRSAAARHARKASWWMSGRHARHQAARGPQACQRRGSQSSGGRVTQDAYQSDRARHVRARCFPPSSGRLACSCPSL